VYQNAEGRGLGIENKIKALELQRTLKINTVEAFELLGCAPDLRHYSIELAALADHHVNKQIKLASQNPRKHEALSKAGYTIVDNLSPRIRVTKYNTPELVTKRDLLGYNISFKEL
jgi:GTP cyclohydrolase II